MKKLITSITLLLAVAFTAKAQTLSVIKGDTVLTYQQSQFKKGDVIQLNYGSGANKQFEFIQTINFPAMKKDSTVRLREEKLESNNSKSTLTITDVYLAGSGKPFIQGRADWAKDFYTKEERDLTIIIDVEGAIDNKEIVAPNNVVASVKKVVKKHK